MKIGLLGYKFQDYDRRRILEELKKLKHDVVKLDLGKLCLTIDKKLSGFQDKIKFDELDVVLPRFSTHRYRFGLLAMRQFKSMGVPTINSYNTIRLCQNKYLTSIMLRKHNIRQPRSFIASSPHSVLKIVKTLENPVIFKLLHGGKGTGVALINSVTEAEDWLTTLHKMGRLIYLQEYIPHDKNEDIRLFVVGDKVVGAMRRVAMHGWKTNFSLGGNKMVAMKPDKKLQKLALKAAKAVHADICGVDVMVGRKGHEVIEVNQHPGFKGLEKATGKNIAREIAKFTIAKAKKHKKAKKKHAKSKKVKKSKKKVSKKNLFHRLKDKIKRKKK